MLKETDLRIGNLVKLGENVVQIKSIHTESVLKNEVNVYIELNKNLSNYCVILSEIEPIQLTEECLVKFNFRKIGTNFENGFLVLHGNLKTGTFDFLLNIPNETKYNVTVIKYVHQLQNLYFALTGTELTLTT